MNTHHRHIEFQLRDLVLINIWPKRFPKGPLKKIYSRKFRLFKVLLHLGTNAYLLELPTAMLFSPISNVNGLIAYHGHDSSSFEDTPIATLFTTSKQRKVIAAILDDEVVSTR